ncbi:hypothetical protein DYBT9275_01460 [Dyadobacter sp. CECT 9275]|uniref:RNA polymerase sigma-70 region 2 domain-containing protein n=1 Tax=Dyadobacter helix TaxID=2822344 RepID=A0A916JAB3_9BACT|nr:RNA polymerase sigma factor [Dyadobacter sp. CECT 9275]CAG4994754.1 hypothetical protein DYBT9275_01460 [Dyadobacter sp. CECT 9275]
MTTEIGFPDLPLIQAIKDGNERAISIFYKENFGRIQNLVYKNSGDADDAKDVYQESMIEVVLQIKKGKLDQLNSKLSTYLYSICYYKWIDRLRKKGRMIETGFGDEPEGAVLEEETESPYPDALEKVMSKIGEKCRDLLRAYYYDKLSMIQIAKELGYADANSAKSQKNKCMGTARHLAAITLKQFYA